MSLRKFSKRIKATKNLEMSGIKIVKQKLNDANKI